MIQYEYPFNERVRTLLRLEDLFERLGFFLNQDHPLQHHVALTTLFEIADVVARADLKAELLKELERQKQALNGLRDNPHIEQPALLKVLQEIDHAIQGLIQMQGKSSQYLNDNEWLASIRSRAIIPGGTCEFDLPSYHAWQQGSAGSRRHDIYRWAQPLLPLQDSASIVLRLLRETGHSNKVIANAGSFQQMLSGRVYQLMQVQVEDHRMIPEISANKYMLWVRFTLQDGEGKPKPTDMDVPFLLTLCNM